jgi:hypothetical protein
MEIEHNFLLRFAEENWKKVSLGSNVGTREVFLTANLLEVC